jgi:DNA-binding CsgD family transcriptional regulator
MDAETFHQLNKRLPCTPRMIQAMQLLAFGLTVDQAALAMGISRKVVNHHLARAKERLGVISRTQLVARAVALGLIFDDFEVVDSGLTSDTTGI